MATMTLAEIRATPLGKTPTIEELIAMVDHLIQHESDIGALTGGGDPGYNSSIDTRWLLTETGGAPDVYVATWPEAAGQNLVEGFNYWLHGQAQTNTGASTLNVGSLEGAVPIKKKTPSGIQDLEAGDMPLFGAYLYYSATNAAWLLINPTNTGVKHITQTTTPTDPSLYNEGDYIYVVEP